MEPETNSFRVEFPDFSCSILQKLNQQRQLGQLCDITVVIQGRHYRAHRAVLAASSPYFCDQVLLKNSMRVVLPDVMHHCVFEGLLQSCYTGCLQLPAGEVVGYLTAASFLQMWHVVDKCTELLGGTGQRSCSSSDRDHDCLSPGDGYRDGDSTGEGLGTDFHTGLIRDPKDFAGGDTTDRPTENGSPATSSEQGGGGEDGEAVLGGPGFQYASRPAYIQPSIMSHRRWIQVKAERREQEGAQGLPGDGEGGAEDKDGGDLNQASPAFGADLEEKLRPEEPLDFYGASMEEFSGDHSGGPLDVDVLEEDPDGDGGGVGGGNGVGDDGTEPSPVLHGEASLPGQGPGYKLYPCQCGKSFTHKSQRDRHMSMHLGLRPYGCAVCGKRFKMKHHLVGHVKIHTGIKPYECGVCGKRFMWRDSFNRHVSSCTRAHQARRAASEQPDPVC